MMTNNCPTCFSEKSQDNFMKLGFCGHSFCKECWTEYIDAEISHFNILKLKCHEHCCSYILSPRTSRDTWRPNFLESIRVSFWKSWTINPELQQPFALGQAAQGFFTIRRYLPYWMPSWSCHLQFLWFFEPWRSKLYCCSRSWIRNFCCKKWPQILRHVQNYCFKDCRVHSYYLSYLRLRMVLALWNGT